MASGLPPSPSVSRIQQGTRMVLEPFEFLTAARAECGDIFSLHMPGDPPRVVTCDPEHIKTIFALAPDTYEMADQAIPLNLGKASPLFLDGDRHRAQHVMLMPPLHGAHLQSYAGLIARATHEAIDRWPEGESFTLLEEMQWITLTAICECVLGSHEGEQIDRLREVTSYWLEGPMSPFALTMSMMIGAGRVRRFLDRQTERSPIVYPNPARKHRLFPWQRLGDAKAELMSMLRQDVERCRTEGRGQRVDVLALLAEARDEHGQPMPVEDVVDVLVTMLVGGYETTANALCWTVHHLLEDAEALTRVHAEADELADAELGKKRPWLDACIKESLRLKPIAPVVNRKLVRPVRLGDYEIPPNTILWPCIYLTQVNEQIWPDPLRFSPERFLADKRPRANEWLAFGGGQRRCIGAAFAEFELRIILATLFARVEIAHAPHSDPRPILRGITVSPRDHLRVTITRKS